MIIIDKIKRLIKIIKNLDKLECFLDKIDTLPDYIKFYEKENSNMKNMFKALPYDYDVRIKTLTNAKNIISELKVLKNGNYKFINNKVVNIKKEKENKTGVLILTVISGLNPLYDILSFNYDNNNEEYIIELNAAIEPSEFGLILDSINPYIDFSYEMEVSTLIDRVVYKLHSKDSNIYKSLLKFFIKLNEEIDKYLNKNIDFTPNLLKQQMIDYIDKFIKNISVFDYILNLDTNEEIFEIYELQKEYIYKLKDLFAIKEDIVI